MGATSIISSDDMRFIPYTEALLLFNSPCHLAETKPMYFLSLALFLGNR